MRLIVTLLAAATAGVVSQAGPVTPQPPKSVRLANLTWLEAAPALTPQTVVVIPVAPGSSEHGPHLPLGTDATLAEYFAGRLADTSPVVVAPTLAVHYAPGLSEYAGSTTIPVNTARDIVADLVRSVARFGPKRFYIVASGDAAGAALDPASALLAPDGILMRYSHFATVADRVSRGIRQQAMIGHADEIETSMLLYAAPDLVQMSKAVRDSSPHRRLDG